MIDYAAAGEWLEAYGTAWQTFDGDGWVACFTDDAEYHEDPFGAPLVGHNALRAYLLEAAATERDVEFTVERHWVSGAMRAGGVARDLRPAAERAARSPGRVPDRRGRVRRARSSRFREWTVRAPGSAG